MRFYRFALVGSLILIGLIVSGAVGKSDKKARAHRPRGTVSDVLPRVA